jgi:hypothetical protein
MFPSQWLKLGDYLEDTSLSVKPPCRFIVVAVWVMPLGSNVCSSVQNTDRNLSRQQDQPPQTQTLLPPRPKVRNILRVKATHHLIPNVTGTIRVTIRPVLA